LFIGGEWIPSITGATSDDYNPATGQPYAHIAEASAADAAKAVEAAHAARIAWAKKTGRERATILLRAADILEKNALEHAQVLINEGGGTFGKAMHEVMVSVENLRAVAEDHKLVTGEVFPSDQPNKLSFTLRQPMGVVVAITPWNYPLILSMKKITHALIMGNTMVLKPAEEAPVTGLKIGELFADAGLPPGVFNVVTGAGPIVGDALVTHPLTRVISFTGSTPTGRIIASKAGALLKRVVLELGGKDPIIVLADTDLDYAVNTVTFHAFLHQGQLCMSGERIIVEESIAEEFGRRLAAKVEKLTVGDPNKPETIVGPMIHKEQIDIVDAHVQDAVAHGARVLCGGERKDPYYLPTVLIGVTPDMRIFQEETFGPVAPIIKVPDVEAAIRVANDSIYGLSCGVLTNDLQKAIHIAEEVEAGMLHINDGTIDDDQNAPFGGVKASGGGREGGRASVEALTEVKWVSIQKGQRQYPF
jgi:aldehyde dehydrogenase (NAD+)